MGTTRITASGNDQLSYWAASMRNTMTTAKAKIVMRRVSRQQFQVRHVGPFVGHGLRQFPAARFSTMSIA